MKYFELLFVGWSCVGDMTFAGVKARPIPQTLRPALASVQLVNSVPACRPRPEIERMTSRAALERRVKELGQGAAPRLRWCEKFRCWDREIVWSDRLVVDGREIK